MSQNILSSDQENADFFQLVLSQIKKGYFIRKWAKNSDIIVKQRIKIKPKQELNKQQEQQRMFECVISPEKFHHDTQQDEILEELSIIHKVKEFLQKEKQYKQPVNLKFGDIVYFKNLVNLSKSNTASEQVFTKGIVAGDGIASNKLECIPQQGWKKNQQKSVLEKNAKLQFRKCLFQVVNAKKYYYHNLMKKAKEMSIEDPQLIEELELKCKQEVEENKRVYERLKNSNIIYGQEIQFRHIYSDTYLRLNTNVLAYQNTCRELSLEEEANEMANFIFLSFNNAKKNGEAVLYSEQVLINSATNSHYFLNIDKTQNAVDNFHKGLEVNASEDQTLLKLCCYMDINVVKEREKNQNKILQSGDFIVLYNRALHGNFGIRRKQDLSKQNLSSRNVKFEIDCKQVIMKQDYFPKECVTANLSEQFQLYLDTYNEVNNIQTLWEIQKYTSFLSNLPSFQSWFRLKNVASGLYLMIRKGQLQLTYDGFQDDCQLFLQPKKISQFAEAINYNQQIKLQTIDLNEIMIMYCLDLSEKELIYKCKSQERKDGLRNTKDFKKIQEMDDLIFIQKSRLDKNKRQRIMFDIKPAEQKYIKIADRVSSQFPYLFDFFVFLQDWGIDKQNPKDLKYTYKLAFLTQKDLYNNVEQLCQTMENLEDFLKNSGSMISLIQSILLQNGIINIVIQVLKLIHFKIYGNPQDPDKQHHALQNQPLLDNTSNEIFERSAQKIAQIKLQKTVPRLYHILFLCIHNNKQCSEYLLSVENGYLEFFLQQLKYYRNNVVDLLKEAVIFMNSEDEKEEQNLNKWVELLDSVTENNVDNQSFIIELLAFSVVDSLDEPLKQQQNLVRKKLFKSIKGQKPIIQKTLCQFFIQQFPKDGPWHPFVAFNFKENNFKSAKKFVDNNSTLSELYKKARDKKDLYQSKFRGFDEKFQNCFDMGFIDGTIEQQIGKRNTGTLQKYENYLVNTLLLYSALCKGRNKKMIKQIQQNKIVGLNKEFIQTCISYFGPIKEDKTNPKKEQIHLRYYRCFVELYDIFFLDVEPLIRISEYNNKCFVLQDLRDFQLDQKSFNLFRDISISKEKKLEIEAQSKDMIGVSEVNTDITQHQMVRTFGKLVVDQEEKDKFDSNQYSLSKQIYQEFFQGTNSLDHPPIRYNIAQFIQRNNQRAKLAQGEKISEEQLANQSLEAFLSNLKIIRNKIDLGHNEKSVNIQIIHKLPNIFIAYIDQAGREDINIDSLEREETEPDEFDNLKHFKQKFQDEKNWIYKYFRKAIIFAGCDSLIVTKVMMEAIKILDTLQKLQIELKIVDKIQEAMRKIKDQQSRQEQTPDQADPVEQKFKDDNIFEDMADESKQIKFITLIYAALQKTNNNPILKQALISNLELNLNKTQTLLQGMGLVEIIDDEYELNLFRKVNGTSETVQTRTPREIEFLVRKSIIYLKQKQQIEHNIKEKHVQEVQNKKKWENLQNHFENLQHSMEQVLELFRLSDYEKEEPNKPKKEYIMQLQNIIRNSGIHKCFLAFLQEIEIQEFTTNEFQKFYNKIVEFLEYFQFENEDNKSLLVPFTSKFLDLALMPYLDESQWQEKESIKMPIQISNILKSILSLYKKNQFGIEKVINIIFKHIKDNNPFEHTNVNTRYCQKKHTAIGVNIKKSYAILQYIKILKSLTFDNQDTLIENQKLILNSIIQNPNMLIMVQPIEQKKLQDFAHKFSTSIHKFLKLKMHISMVHLMTFSCKNYLQGIQEIQRIILFDSLKNGLIETNSPFMLKRAYLKAIFEIYTNRVIDLENENCNETIGIQEISEILSKEIIPQLDSKNIYQYLEGLVKYNKGDNIEQIWDTRRQIIKQKANFFWKYKEFYTMAQEDLERLKNPEADDLIRKKIYVGVVKDTKEFWKYLMDKGVLHFLADSYDERRQEFEVEPGHTSETTLADDFSIVKTNLVRLKQLYEIIDKEFQVRTEFLNLAEYKFLISKLEELIPRRKITKFGINYRIEPHILGHNKNGMKLETFQTLDDDIFGSEKEEIEDKIRTESKFKKCLRRFMIRNRIDIDQFIKIVEFQRQKGVKLLEKGMFNVLNKNRVYADSYEINNFIRDECKIDPPKDKQEGDEEQATDEFTPSNMKCITDLLKNYFYQKRINPPVLGKDDKKIIIQQVNIIQTKKKYQVQLMEYLKMKLNVNRKNLAVCGVNTPDIEEQIFEENSDERIIRDYEIMQILIDLFEESKHKVENYSFKPSNRQQTISSSFFRFLLTNIYKQSLPEKALPLLSSTEAFSINYDYFQIEEEQFDEYKIELKQIMMGFINGVIQIFQNKVVYLIKIVRILMEAKQPLQMDLDNLKSSSLEKIQDSNRRIQVFEVLQQSCIDNGLHILALDCLKSCNNFELQLEALKILILILHLGYQNSQQCILDIFNKNIIVSQQFFQYLREFFQQDVDHEIRYMRLGKDKQDSFQSQFEVKTKMILLLLQHFCENVNRNFQNFLRVQTHDQEDKVQPSINIVLECSNFLSRFLEDEELNIKLKDEIIISCINSLNEFCTGNSENQKFVCSNKRLFTFINSKIIIKANKGQPTVRLFSEISLEEKRIVDEFKRLEIKKQNSDEKEKGGPPQTKKEEIWLYQNKEKYQAIKNSTEDNIQDLEMFSASIKFILVMITGNKNEDSVKYIVEQIQLDNLVWQLKYMYKNRLKKQQRNIELENHCMEYDNVESRCQNYYCKDGKVTMEEKTIVKTAFNIYIFFSYLCDMNIENNAAINLFRYDVEQEETQKSFFQRICGSCTYATDTADAEDQDVEKSKIQNNKVRPIGSEVKYTIENVESAQQASTQIDYISMIKLLKQQIHELENKERIVFKRIDINNLPSTNSQPQSLRLPSANEPFMKWFKQLIGIQEIVDTQTNQLQKVYFQKPFVSLYLTEIIKLNLIYESDRNSDQQRIQFLLDNYKSYFNQMQHKQYLHNYQLLYYLINNREFLKRQSYYLVLMITLVQIITYGETDDRVDTILEVKFDPQKPYQILTAIQFLVTIVQLTLSGIILISCAIERYPLSIGAGFGDSKKNELQAMKDSAGFTGDTFSKYYFYFLGKLSDIFSLEEVNKSFIKKLFMIMLDSENIYNLGYLLVTVYALTQPFAYAILLFDIVKSSEDLKNVLMAIWLNVKKIFIFAFLGFSIMYIYGIIGWNYFRDYYGDNGWTFLNTITYTIKAGLMNGGGITDGGISPPAWGEDSATQNNFWARYAFDLTFFILINMLFIQIIFGIILDTFGELRGTKKDLQDQIEGICFICGLEKSEIDQKSRFQEMGWYHHIYLEHNVYHMLFYIIYISNMHENDCDSLEKSVKKDITNGGIKFVPIQQSLEVTQQEVPEIGENQE